MLDKFLAESHYDVRRAIVFSNEMEVSEKNGILYMPVYYAMFIGQPDEADGQLLFEPVLPPVLTQE